MKWLHDHQWVLPESSRVVITKEQDTYREFPDHPDLVTFDRADRKFFAVANAHPEKPPILQATDSKWWGWQEALRECGIRVCFLCEEYAREKYRQKMGS